MSLDESTIQLTPVPALWPPAEDRPAPTPAATLPAPDADNAMPAIQGPLQPAQFAILLAEALAGVRPTQQMAPWLTPRAALHLNRLTPMFRIGHQPRILRILTTRPAADAVEMTLVAAFGARPRALAIRLELGGQHGRWQCTDIESA
jgi:hypothetical protein